MYKIFSITYLNLFPPNNDMIIYVGEDFEIMSLFENKVSDFISWLIKEVTENVVGSWIF